MPTPLQQSMRPVRVLLVSSTTFFLGAAAHVLGGGRLPAVPGLAVLVALTVLAVSVASRGRLRFWLLLPTMSLLELALHTGLDILSAPAAAASGTTAGPAPAGHLLHGLHTAVPMPLDGAAGMAHHMSTAHLLATLASVLVLVAGDRTAVRAAAMWAAALPDRLVLVLPAPLPPRPVPAATRRPRVARDQVFTSGCVVRRGPPTLLGRLALT